MALCMAWVEKKEWSKTWFQAPKSWQGKRKKIGTCLILSADANYFVSVWLLVLNTCGAIRQEKKSGPKFTGIHLNQWNLWCSILVSVLLQTAVIVISVTLQW